MMIVRVVHKKTKKDYYLRDVVRVRITEIGTKGDPEFIYRIKRKYKPGEYKKNGVYEQSEETVTEESAIRGGEYSVVDIYEEEDWYD